VSVALWGRYSRGDSGALLLAAVLVLAGCAGLAPTPDAEDPAATAGAEIRPEAPAEYDVLVAQHHASEGRQAEALAAYQRAAAKDPDSAYLQRLLAESLARSSRLDEAVVHARRAHELDPDDVATRGLLAQLYRIKREPMAAAAILVDDEGFPLDAEAAFLLYQIQLETGSLEEALGTAEWMVDHDPDPLRARIALANAYQRLGRPVDAERALRDALEIEPGNLRIYTALARSKRERGDRAGEIAIYREVLDQFPDDHGTLEALAEAQMDEDDLDGAIATFLEIERRYPGDHRSLVRLGFLLYEARRFEEASLRFERVLSIDPEEYEIVFFLGISRRRAGQDAEAAVVFEQIPAGHEHYAEARTQIAAIHERAGRYAEAMAEVDLALAAEVSRPRQLYRATLLMKSGDFDGAVAYLEALRAEAPDDDELVYNLGVLYGEADRIDEAITFMLQALELNPDNASALNYIGYTWAERGEKLDQAEEMIMRAIELRPEDGFIVDSLGWVYYMRARPLVESGKRSQARAYIDRALEELMRADDLTGGDPVISEHLGDTYLLDDQRRRALDHFEEALNLGPREGEQPDLHEKLETLRRELE
jgi:tetratricopeptide (TPR) repeat protein